MAWRGIDLTVIITEVCLIERWHTLQSYALELEDELVEAVVGLLKLVTGKYVECYFIGNLTDKDLEDEGETNKMILCSWF